MPLTLVALIKTCYNFPTCPPGTTLFPPGEQTLNRSCPHTLCKTTVPHSLWEPLCQRWHSSPTQPLLSRTPVNSMLLDLMVSVQSSLYQAHQQLVAQPTLPSPQWASRRSHAPGFLILSHQSAIPFLFPPCLSVSEHRTAPGLSLGPLLHLYLIPSVTSTSQVALNSICITMTSKLITLPPELYFHVPNHL